MGTFHHVVLKLADEANPTHAKSLNDHILSSVVVWLLAQSPPRTKNHRAIYFFSNDTAHFVSFLASLDILEPVAAFGSLVPEVQHLETLAAQLYLMRIARPKRIWSLLYRAGSPLWKPRIVAS